MIGQILSHYRILAMLGAGGMGEVYRARDERLGRDVALKVLPADVALDPERLVRFEREARSIAQLNHPNIVTIHSVEEADGVHFLTMELVEGQTLSKLLSGGECCLDRFFELAVPLADAVSCAHSRGVVHRDLKPVNIMLDEAGRLKVLDFGLVKLFEPDAATKPWSEQATMDLGDSPTVAGCVLGTPDYMSPEQAEGKAVDHRSDLFSLGVILYEMATGKHPFRGESAAATISSILRDSPPSATDVQPELPRHLGRIVAHCLEKETDRRYQSALDLRNDLEGLRRELEVGSGADEKIPRRRQGWIGIVTAVAVVAAVVLGAWRLWTGGDEPPDQGGRPERTMIAVLPFENLGPPDEEYFSDGITEAITTRLATIKDLGVISRQSANQYKSTDKTLRQIGNELGVEYVLVGAVQRERPGDPESPVRVTPQLVCVSDDTHLWATSYDEEMAGVFRIQSEIAEKVAGQLNVTLLGSESDDVDERPTGNLEAYDFFLRGCEYLDATSFSLASTGLQTVVELLRTAVDLDPDFLQAWSKLTTAYEILYWGTGRPEILPLMKEAADRTWTLAPNSPEAQLAQGYVDYAGLRYEEALGHFELALDRRHTADILKACGMAQRRLGRWDEALSRFREGARLAPLDYIIEYDGLANSLSLIGRFVEAGPHWDRAISLTPDLPDAYLDRAYFEVVFTGDQAVARRILREMRERTDPLETAVIGQAHVFIPAVRLFVDTYAWAFDAFETIGSGKYGTSEPATAAWVHLVQAVIAETRGDRVTAIDRYDSARVHYEPVTRPDYESAHVCFFHSNLGLACAGLGRVEEAIFHGEEATRLLPAAKDAVVGNDLARNLVEIYLRCGEYETAIDQLEELVETSAIVTPHLLRADPLWDPVRDHPRFRRLVEGS
jgi:TolB-like protein/tetratricopeptide (TPR) repeat protein